LFFCFFVFFLTRKPGLLFDWCVIDLFPHLLQLLFPWHGAGPGMERPNHRDGTTRTHDLLHLFLISQWNYVPKKSSVGENCEFCNLKCRMENKCRRVIKCTSQSRLVKCKRTTPSVSLYKMF
jgi:hypothetical protein